MSHSDAAENSADDLSLVGLQDDGRGPHGKRLNPRYETPVIVSDDLTRTNRLMMRLFFVSQWLVARNGILSGWLGYKLLAVAADRFDPRRVVIRPKDNLDDDALAEHDLELQRGLCGLWWTTEEP